ncbi:BRCT domain-containing protein [Nitrosospira briensis]|uniref:BRCT domain-containing protein n=1 Tax=Nitrosospira briensis TaxID=35799 RepID=UPI00046A7761|nr:BRCT domain-containing protein [Nitrosospira briensis]
MSWFRNLFGSRSSEDNKINDPEDPRLLKIHANRLINRDIDQLTGICEFALQDGHVDQSEAEAILGWLNNHKACLDTWPANVLYDRLRRILADGALDSDEQADLLTLIMRVASPRAIDGSVIPSSLPIDDPVPDIIFEGRNFCLTGVFDFGSRAECQEAVVRHGGIPIKGVTKKLHYLVIGNVGSEVWKHTSFGLKIAKAVSYRESGVPLAIIAENHWTDHIV